MLILSTFFKNQQYIWKNVGSSFNYYVPKENNQFFLEKISKKAYIYIFLHKLYFIYGQIIPKAKRIFNNNYKN